MDVECRYSQADGSRIPVLTWETINSSGIELSVDNPGIVGSYGNYGPAGSLELPPNGCDPRQGRQIYTVYAVGIDGSTVSRTIFWVPPPTAPTAPTSTSVIDTTIGTTEPAGRPTRTATTSDTVNTTSDVPASTSGPAPVG